MKARSDDKALRLTIYSAAVILRVSFVWSTALRLRRHACCLLLLACCLSRSPFFSSVLFARSVFLISLSTCSLRSCHFLSLLFSAPLLCFARLVSPLIASVKCFLCVGNYCPDLGLKQCVLPWCWQLVSIFSTQAFLAVVFVPRISVIFASCALVKRKVVVTALQSLSASFNVIDRSFAVCRMHDI